MVSKCLKGSAVIFWLIGTGTYIASMITVMWLHSSNNNLSGTFNNINLFKKCYAGICSDQGWDITTENGSVSVDTFVPRILMLAGAFFVVIGFVFALASTCSDNPCPLISEGSLEITGGIIILVACAVFTALNFPQKSLLDQEEFGYSFYLGWASGLAFVISGALTCSSARS